MKSNKEMKTKIKAIKQGNKKIKQGNESKSNKTRKF